jgi:hypothetical protein
MVNEIYIEIYRPCFPDRGVKVRSHRPSAFSRDVLSPDMITVFRVEGTTKKEEALALIAEKLAGRNTTVYKVFG